MSKLSYEGFTEAVKRLLPVYLGEEFEEYFVDEKITYKVNEKLHTLFLNRKDNTGGHFTPNIYLEDYYAEYEKGKEIYDIVDEMSKRMKAVTRTGSAQYEAKLEEGLLDNVYAVLVNADMNDEYLKEIPHRRFLDLAIIFRVMKFLDNGTNISITITNELLKGFGIEEKNLYEMALANNKKNMQTRMFFNKAIDGFAIVTNQQKMYGAYNGIIDIETLKTLSKMFKDDLYIAPSSIHEVVVVSCEVTCPEILKQIEQETLENGALKEEEFLSGNVYKYDRKKNKVYIAK